MFSIAALLFDTTWQFIFLISILAMIFSIVWVLPVPGGPSMTLTLLFIAFSTALYWLELQPNGNIRKSMSFPFIILFDSFR